MLTLKEYCIRKDDIKLNATFAAMRYNQRLREYSLYIKNCMMANAYPVNRSEFCGILSIIGSPH